MIQNNSLNNLQIGGEKIGYVTSYPYLGIKLDNKLTFELHIKETLMLVSHKLFLLSKIRKYLTHKQALTIFKSKILPYFDYGDIFCIGSHEKSLIKLQKMQNRGFFFKPFYLPWGQYNRQHSASFRWPPATITMFHVCLADYDSMTVDCDNRFIFISSTCSPVCGSGRSDGLPGGNIFISVKSCACAVPPGSRDAKCYCCICSHIET